jgi:hypothetical protein
MVTQCQLNDFSEVGPVITMEVGLTSMMGVDLLNWFAAKFIARSIGDWTIWSFKNVLFVCPRHALQLQIVWRSHRLQHMLSLNITFYLNWLVLKCWSLVPRIRCNYVLNKAAPCHLAVNYQLLCEVKSSASWKVKGGYLITVLDRLVDFTNNNYRHFF